MHSLLLFVVVLRDYFLNSISANSIQMVMKRSPVINSLMDPICDVKLHLNNSLSFLLNAFLLFLISLVSIASRCQPHHKIVIRQVDSL
uniref:Ovule protein n=1 Tax=Heterorhabditis bacteriophora TaxID=37862 RepID=A0A1I7WNB3_HETBA